jgi:superfamily II RNA helicase
MELTSYKTMMQGKPQKLVSKFKISYNLLLNLIDIGDQDFLKFVQRSMIQEDIELELGAQYYKITEKEREIEMLDTSMQHLRTPQEVVQRYINCVEARKTAVNKKRKELDREVQSIQESNKNIDADVRTLAKYNEKIDIEKIIKI